MTREIHVATAGSDVAPGTPEAPLRTINRAAQLAQPGDSVVVHAGTYREWVKPARGGLDDARRITYRPADGQHVLITGAERVTTWENVGGTVWRAVLPNAMFGDFNPYREEVRGDWLEQPVPGVEPPKHLGDVWLDGRSFYEVATPAEVTSPQRRDTHMDIPTGHIVPTHEPEWTTRVWTAEVGDDATTIWANFQGAEPNTALTEVSVRRSVFLPEGPGINFVTVRGFELAQAATPWAPPTADQPGLIGPNWAKGWVIEDNLIWGAKNVAVSLGKEATTGNNHATDRGDKPGYQYQIESVFEGLRFGWSKETVGGHVVRRNTIRDCEQAGIVGHMGCAFSLIEGNHIYRIGLKREFFGHEIAGIKFHAAIDTQIVHNRIHDTPLGVWLDWQTQGTRISRNLLYRNMRDLFIEVSHGPFTVDHNVLASRCSLELVCQGGAFVNNLVAGCVRLQPTLDRSTPYHLPHSTQVAGFGLVAGGDDRWTGNLFFGGKVTDAYDPIRIGPLSERGFGTHVYDHKYPSSWQGYVDSLDPALGDHLQFHGVCQAAYVWDNAYVSGARPFAAEVGAVVADDEAAASLDVVEPDGDDAGAVYLDLRLPAAVTAARTAVVTGADLPAVRLVAAGFEEPDGSPVRCDTDLVGASKVAGRTYAVGPVSALSVAPEDAPIRVRVW
ncbi:right-handed parallel beta-helix repeat-containing protein [Xylanimonas protaetiae]|uniref:DUF1565 domain-containing protein n=1 Tax=Xylanimonas protaetiae TaxID=2509457 RepID=A0A4P6FLZ0_9MICO|nr:right-handed parallel beta-helix repeat-containing protein [Xylanimonas protaetiae]QAY71658.1 DUF1565 domain-containing protein [Xylanimonas protaetiae]